MIADARKVCFVVMGFGKKTDYESGRTLDLDATYEAIIRPVAEQLNLRCIRADEIMHSGIIDTPMYEMLLRADLVIADISTGNVNAVYELGVRHALRPNTTIIMKEIHGKLQFDLNHISTFHYQHLGEDIGMREALRAQTALSLLVTEAMSSRHPDSPVYTYLPKLQRPQLSDEQYAELLADAEMAQDHLARLMKLAENARDRSEHEEAAKLFNQINEIKPHDPFIVQQLALTTYKSKLPSPVDALFEGLNLITKLDPENSNDPETLGITGAIRKRLWLITNERAQLDSAIKLYGRGFEIRRDYYNGENLAACFDFRAAVQHKTEEELYDRMSATKVRISIVEILKNLLDSPNFFERSDQHWIFATLANCLYALGNIEEGNFFEKKFLSENPANWEVETFREGKFSALRFLN